MLVFGSDFLFGIHFGYFPKGYPTFDHGGLEPNHPSSDFFLGPRKRVELPGCWGYLKNLSQLEKTPPNLSSNSRQNLPQTKMGCLKLIFSRCMDVFGDFFFFAILAWQMYANQ